MSTQWQRGACMTLTWSARLLGVAIMVIAVGEVANLAACWVEERK